MAVTFHGVTNRSAQNSAGRRTYSVTFRLSTNDKADGPFTVGSHPDLPVIGSLWPEDRAAYCNHLSVENSDPWRGWLVTAQYTDERTYGTSLNPTGGAAGGNPGTGKPDNPYKGENAVSDPVYDGAKISWSGHTYEEVITNDAVNGTPILNSAGDPFAEPVTREVTDAICTVSYSSTDGPPSEVLALQNKVNDEAIEVDGRTFPARSMRMQNLTVGPNEYRGNTLYRTISFQLKYRSGRTFRVGGQEVNDPSAGWSAILLSTGYSQVKTDINTGEQKKAPCLNPDGTLVTEPALLGFAGDQIVVDDFTLAAMQEKAHYEEYYIYEQGDFTILKGVSAV